MDETCTIFIGWWRRRVLSRFPLRRMQCVSRGYSFIKRSQVLNVNLSKSVGGNSFVGLKKVLLGLLENVTILKMETETIVAWKLRNLVSAYHISRFVLTFATLWRPSTQQKRKAKCLHRGIIKTVVLHKVYGRMLKEGTKKRTKDVCKRMYNLECVFDFIFTTLWRPRTKQRRRENKLSP